VYKDQGPATGSFNGLHRENNFLAIRFFQSILGNAGRIGIFAFEEFPHESGSKPLSLAQIRRLEVPVSLFSPKNRPSEPPKHLFHPPISPPTGPAAGSSIGLHRENNFLAIIE
jgi:hypothetical protein